MARRLDGSDKGVLITQESARRIQRVVQRIEGGDRNIPPVPIRTAFEEGEGLRVGKVAAAWAIGTCATVTLWERAGANCAPTAKSPSETIENVVNLSYHVPAGSWVVIGQAADGKWYLVESGVEGACRKTIGGEDVTQLLGWNASTKQTLSHADGCLKWTNAETSSSGSCRKPQIYDYDLTALAGYSASKKQALVHDNGCLKWMDIEACP